MTFQLRKAERKQAKLRIGIFGPSGSGKTMSALKLARGLAGDWDKIAVIDTENGSADLYSQLGPYNVITLPAPYSPEKYIEAIEACEEAGMEAVVIDSITHEWAGAGGILEIADQLGKDAKNSFTVWAKLTPRHNKFIEKILSSPCHVICCGRSKQEHVLNQTERNGKTVSVPEKIGMRAITRDGFDYEMTVAFELSITHLATSTKDRTSMFQDRPEAVITEEFGQRLKEWCESGKADLNEQKREIMRQLKRLGYESGDRQEIVGFVMKLTGLDLQEGNYAGIIDALAARKKPSPNEMVLPAAPAEAPEAPAAEEGVTAVRKEYGARLAAAATAGELEAVRGEMSLDARVQNSKMLEAVLCKDVDDRARALAAQEAAEPKPEPEVVPEDGGSPDAAAGPRPNKKRAGR